MVFWKRKSPSLQKECEASTSTAISIIKNEIDWVSNAFRVAELASAAGGLLPFPYLTGAANLVMALLKPIQQIQQNRDTYKTLTINVTNILQVLHEETKKDSEIASLNSFEEDCETFYRYLQHIFNDLDSFNKPDKPKLLRRYFAADRERDTLVRYQSQIEEFRNNLVLRGIMRIQTSSNDADWTDSNFEKIRLGDLNVLTNSSEEQVEHWEVRWRHETRTRMVRVYKGRNAISRFKAEKEWYSRHRHPNLMQLFGVIPCKERPGLVFHNSWCKPLYSLTGPTLPRYMEKCYIESSCDEGLKYVADDLSEHAIFLWMDLTYSRAIIGFQGREDGYISVDYVNTLDGRGTVAFEWRSNILRDVRDDPAYKWTPLHIDNRPRKELMKVMERVQTKHLSTQRNDPLDPSFLWDLYGIAYVHVWVDVPAPAYPVWIGAILWGNGEEEHRVEASNAELLAFYDCKSPSSLNCVVRSEELHTCFKTANRLPVEDHGRHFRIRIPMDTASVSTTADLQKVVIEFDLQYADPAAWERLTRAHISQISYLFPRTIRMRVTTRVCVVSGFSWHLQIPTRVGCSIGSCEYEELYFFISKPGKEEEELLDMYWSFNPLGSERLNNFDLDSLGFDSRLFRISSPRVLRVFDICKDDLELIWDAHVALNIDPEGNKAARKLNLPLLMLMMTGSGDVTDVDSDSDGGPDIDTVDSDAESYHTAEDGAENEEEDEVDFGRWISHDSEHRTLAGVISRRDRVRD